MVATSDGELSVCERELCSEHDKGKSEREKKA